MITDLDRIKEILQKAKIKPTYLRMRLLKYLLEKKEHPTGKMIYQVLKKELPTISLTSIYNNLELFAQKGLVKIILLDPKEIRFNGKKGHHHFFCEKCQRIIDLTINCPLIKKKKIYGHLIKDWDGYFFGICKDCQKDG